MSSDTLLRRALSWCPHTSRAPAARLRRCWQLASAHCRQWCADKSLSSISVHSETGDVALYYEGRLARINVAVMRAPDMLTLLFSSFVVGLSVCSEIRDVELARKAIVASGENISAGWRRALTALNLLRRWVFVPSLVCSVPNLVVYQGADSLAV